MIGVNEDEIIDFIKLLKTHPIHTQFIEFMPFDGNKWDMSKMVSYQDVLDRVSTTFEKEEVQRINDLPNDTSKNYQIKGYKDPFVIISTVINPFCDSCNRIRLTANGQIKNCLYGQVNLSLLNSLLPFPPHSKVN